MLDAAEIDTDMGEQRVSPPPVIEGERGV